MLEEESAFCKLTLSSQLRNVSLAWPRLSFSGIHWPCWLGVPWCLIQTNWTLYKGGQLWALSRRLGTNDGFWGFLINCMHCFLEDFSSLSCSLERNMYCFRGKKSTRRLLISFIVNYWLLLYWGLQSDRPFHDVSDAGDMRIRWYVITRQHRRAALSCLHQLVFTTRGEQLHTVTELEMLVPIYTLKVETSPVLSVQTCHG